ncbi:hypothetical protein [Shewanella sp. SR43-8]|uniref:hypothetical protein n=1 Tax=Shewanella sp. SR43-8 TaxID=2760938 RepID=UPI001603EFD2|nr:hypothetical protein [Shewanella sp. SR43-8]MBB1322117.1 hypothetical protein [Shewanella sp. SR43-8]
MPVTNSHVQGTTATTQTPRQPDFLNFDLNNLLFPWDNMELVIMPEQKPYPGLGGTMEPTKGVRNNNPLNVEYSASNPWNGQTGSDGRFATFSSVFYGIRAAAKTMKTYRDKYGLNTVRGIVNRWAPPSDNNPTGNYIDFVSRKAGVSQSQVLTQLDYVQVVAAMISFENGYNPYDINEISAAVSAGFN